MQPNVSRPKANILFIGGSNTVMKSGYCGTTVRALADHFEIGQVKNISVGGTTLGMALWTTLKLERPQDYDLIFIEYTVNDYSLAKTPDTFANWKWAFETLLGHLRTRNPKARIHNLIFGRRDKYECPIQQALTKATIEISQRYHVHPIMVDEYVRGLTGDPAGAGKKLYSDRAHYTRPLVTSLIANYVARIVISEDLNLQAALNNAAAVPSPYPVHSCDHSLFAPLGETRTFKNSLYEMNAVALSIDGPWQEITAPGSLLNLNYVSTRESARILVAEEGERPIAFDTLHKRTANGDFAFLLRNLLFSWKKPPTGTSQPRKIALRAVADKSVPDDLTFIKQVHIVPPKSAKSSTVVYVSGALFS